MDYLTLHPPRLYALPFFRSLLGMAWDGTYFYVVDQSGKVYAYDSSWAYQSGRSFYLHSANTGPRGITWDGTYFYVVDRTDDKVYVYDSDGNHVG